MGSKNKAATTDEHDKVPSLGDLVVIEKGRFKGWVGLLDDESDDGKHKAYVYPMYPLHCETYVTLGRQDVRSLTPFEERIDQERSKAPNAMSAACLSDALKRDPSLPTTTEMDTDVAAMAMGLPYRDVSEARLVAAIKPFAVFIQDHVSGKHAIPPSTLHWTELHGVFQLLTKTTFAPSLRALPAPAPAENPPAARPAVFTPGLATFQRRKR